MKVYEIPPTRDEQLAAAQAALDRATSAFHQADDAKRAAIAEYAIARQADPASTATSRTWNAWLEAERDLVDARADMEHARDHLTAINRQTTTETP